MPSADELPAATLARFSAAEAQLYPIALVDPDEYERATRLVGLLAAELRTEAADITTVLDLRDELISRVPIVAAEAGLALVGLPPETITDAASAIRCRELQAARAATRWADRLAVARAAGEEWIDGELDAQAALAGSYRSTAWHVPTGTRLTSAVEAGSAGAQTAYTIEITREGALTESEAYPDRESWLAAVRRCRAQIAGEHC